MTTPLLMFFLKQTHAKVLNVNAHRNGVYYNCTNRTDPRRENCAKARTRGAMLLWRGKVRPKVVVVRLAVAVCVFISVSISTRNTRHSVLPRIALVVSRLRNADEPFVVLPEFWSREKAIKAGEEAKQAVASCHQRVNLDYRRLGVNEVRGYPLAREFAEDRYLRNIAREFLQKRLPTVKAQYGLTLRTGNSGDGWHQDSKQRGIKALMYLQDIDNANGPFQLLLKYNASSLKHKEDARGRNTRFTDEHVLWHTENNARVHTVLGKAGTVVIFDTSNLHRGQDVHELGRLSLTNYYDTRLKTTSCKRNVHLYEDLSDLTSFNMIDIETKRKEGMILMDVDL
jgi:hypothetical protein